MMKKMLSLTCLVAAVWLVPVLASATHIENFVATGDCEGWNIAFDVKYIGVDATADLTYSIILLEEGGAEVARAEGAELLQADGSTTWASYSYAEAWGLELCGTYVVQVYAGLSPDYTTWVDEETAELTFVCECDDEEGACTYTPGYWKNHLEMWPLRTVRVGADELSQDEAMAILNTPVRGDATIILAYHLIAATLNVAGGADSSIQSAIDEANDLLMQTPVGSRPHSRVKGPLLAVKDILASYNELPCMDDDNDCPLLDKSMGAVVEETSFGSLKAMYR